MASPRFDVVGIGNAIVDVIARCEDGLLARHRLSKGHMRLIEEHEIGPLYADMGQAVEISGGSAANTIAGVASFGGRAAYIGKVADDEFGRIFGHDIRSMGVSYDTQPAKNSAPTARCLVLVTPDGQRTMNTFLGVSTSLGPAEIVPETIAAGTITYLEGYLFDRPEAKRAFIQAADIARGAGRKVALSLSDGFCVDRHRAEFLELIRSCIDILFANADEIASLYQTKSFEAACTQSRKDCALAAITRSEKGSVILQGNETIEIAAEPVGRVADTTGAGDLYAAGFLFGHARGLSLATCGRLASIAAAEVIGHIGARPEVPLRELAGACGVAI